MIRCRLIAISVAALAGAAFSARNAQATVCSANDYNIVATDIDIDGGYYDFLAGTVNNTTWGQAQTCAQSLNGNLATISSGTLNDLLVDAIKTYLPSGEDAWIGLNAPGGFFSSSSFGWVDGSSASYRNWEGGFPSGGSDLEFVYTGDSGTWANANNDNFASEAIGAIVEVPAPAPDPVPEPASLALLGAALAGFGAVWRRRRAA